MATLAVNTPLVKGVSEVTALPVIASDIIYEGAAVGLNAAGYARPLVAGDMFCGHAAAKADNSASAVAGAKTVTVYRGKYSAEVTITTVAVTDVGKPVFMSDDAVYTLTRDANSRVGKVTRYVTTNTCMVEFEPQIYISEFLCSFTPELDCETLIDTADHMLLPGWMNPHGVQLALAWGVVTETVVGATEDQPVITISDESDNALSTLTGTDTTPEAAGDVIMGTNPLIGATTGDTVKTVAAGEYVDCKVTQATSGTGTAGKVKVHALFVPNA